MRRRRRSPGWKGAYALAVVFAGHHGLMVGAQHGAPLAVGFGEDEMFLGSDSLALAPLTQRIAFLRDGDWAVLSRGGARFFDGAGQDVQREVRRTVHTGAAIGKDGFRHFMEKELHEHPSVIGQVLQRMIDPATRTIAMPALPFDLAAVPRATVTACGSAYYAGLVGPALAGGRGAAADRCRRGQRIALPRAAAAAGRAGRAGEPVRRDRRHAGGAAVAARAPGSTC